MKSDQTNLRVLPTKSIIVYRLLVSTIKLQLSWSKALKSTPGLISSFWSLFSRFLLPNRWVKEDKQAPVEKLLLLTNRNTKICAWVRASKHFRLANSLIRYWCPRDFGSRGFVKVGEGSHRSSESKAMWSSNFFFNYSNSFYRSSGDETQRRFRLLSTWSDNLIKWRKIIQFPSLMVLRN